MVWAFLLCDYETSHNLWQPSFQALSWAGGGGLHTAAGSSSYSYWSSQISFCGQQTWIDTYIVIIVKSLFGAAFDLIIKCVEVILGLGLGRGRGWCRRPEETVHVEHNPTFSLHRAQLNIAANKNCLVNFATKSKERRKCEYEQETLQADFHLW